MTETQNIRNPFFTDASGTPTAQDLAPNGAGVDFTTTTGSISVPFGPGVTPILTNVTVPPTNTNAIRSLSPLPHPPDLFWSDH